MKNIVVDLRGLPPPEPMIGILSLLGDDPIEAWLPHEPAPLYALLEERGFGHEVKRSEPGLCVLLIRKKP